VGHGPHRLPETAKDIELAGFQRTGLPMAVADLLVFVDELPLWAPASARPVSESVWAWRFSSQKDCPRASSLCSTVMGRRLCDLLRDEQRTLLQIRALDDRVNQSRIHRLVRRHPPSLGQQLVGASPTDTTNEQLLQQLEAPDNCHGRPRSRVQVCAAAPG
jgi:hypothetical protein